MNFKIITRILVFIWALTTYLYIEKTQKINVCNHFSQNIWTEFLFHKLEFYFCLRLTNTSYFSDIYFEIHISLEIQSWYCC